jgi:hypothetical protein
MWSLVKSELIYYKWLFILSFLLIILINIGLTFDNRWIEAQGDFPGLRVIWLGVGIVVLFFTILFNRKSGRLRTKALLPISNYKLGLSRWISFLFFWFVLISVLLIFYLINYDGTLNQNWATNLISITGVILIINSIPILYSDFINTYFKKWEKAIVGLLWIIIFFQYISLNIIFSTYLDFLAPEFMFNSRETITNLYFTNIITFGGVVWGLTMFLSTIYTFKKRKLYLE